MQYVVGFLFSSDLEEVVLIRKLRPSWQENKLNGVGGKLEPHELTMEGGIFAAMEREFFEETGLMTGPAAGILWSNVATLSGKDYCVNVFSALTDYKILHSVTSKTEERVEVHLVRNVRREITVPNLAWLVPLCMTSHKDKNFRRAIAYYG